jgi:hypothetical protein
MIKRRFVSIVFVVVAGCARESPAEPRELPVEPPASPLAPADSTEEAPTARGPQLLWIFPKLSATLKGEQAEPLSQPVELELEGGRLVRLGVRLSEGEVVERPGDRGRRQLVVLELLELLDDGEPRSLHRFTLPLAEGPDVEPTDDMLRATVERGARVVVRLERRGLREHEEELERVPEVIATVVLRMDDQGLLRAETGS